MSDFDHERGSGPAHHAIGEAPADLATPAAAPAEFALEPGEPAEPAWLAGPEHAERHGIPIGELLPVRALPWAVAIIAGTALLGALLAFAWSALGPHVGVVMTADGPNLADLNSETYAGGDVRFAELTAAAGVLSGLAAWQVRRWRGPLLLVAVALGNLGAAFIAAKLGATLGRDTFNHLLTAAPRGSTFDKPMKLEAEGLYFLQPIVAVAVYMVCAAWSRHADLVPERFHSS
jgi:hypothetical protein